jgi:WXG100 family type VII secretion target
MRHGAQPASGYPTPAGGATSGGGFDTSLHTMDTARNHISEVGQAMTASVDRLMGQLEALTPQKWDGDAYRAFLQAKTSWHAAHDHIRKALADIESCMQVSTRQYDTADVDSQTGIRNATGGLG